MTARRRNLSEFIPDVPTESPALPDRPAVDEQDSAARPAELPPGGRPRRPTARDLAAPARPAVAREALKVDVPADLALVHRLHRRRLDTGMDIRDQVAIAVDEWLTGQGY